MIILDTDLISILQRGASAGAELLLRKIDEAQVREPVVTSVITYEEQIRGWFHAMSLCKALTQQIPIYARLRSHAEYYSAHRLVDFDEAAAVEFQRLKRLKVRIGTMDLKIAAIALANNASLWSRNLGDFRQVPGLRVEDVLG